MESLALNVVFLRQRIGITGKQLAMRLGVGETTIYNIETGYITAPKLSILEALANVFDTTVEGLIGKKPLVIQHERAQMVYIVDSIDARRPFVELDRVVGCVFIDRDKLRGHEHFGLTVKDNAMANRRILAGDVVIVKKDCPIKNDDIVVAVVENNENALIRVYHKSKNRILLKAANDSGLYGDITLDSEKDSYNLIGKVIKCEFNV